MSHFSQNEAFHSVASIEVTGIIIHYWVKFTFFSSSEKTWLEKSETPHISVSEIGKKLEYSEIAELFYRIAHKQWLYCIFMFSYGISLIRDSESLSVRGIFDPITA